MPTKKASAKSTTPATEKAEKPAKAAKPAAAKAKAKAAPKAKAEAKAKTKTKAKEAVAETKAAAPKAPRKTAAGNLRPSPELAAVIGGEPVGRGEVMKKLWDYIKAHGLQDPADKRTIRADAKLRAVLGKDSVGMFELAGIAGKHLTKGA